MFLTVKISCCICKFYCLLIWDWYYVLQLISRADDLAEMRRAMSAPPKTRTPHEEQVYGYVSYLPTQLLKIPENLWLNFTMDMTNLIQSYINRGASGTMTMSPSDVFVPPAYPFAQSSTQRMPPPMPGYQPTGYTPMQRSPQTSGYFQGPTGFSTSPSSSSDVSTSMMTAYPRMTVASSPNPNPGYLPSPSGFTMSPSTSSYVAPTMTQNYPQINTPQLLPVSPGSPAFTTGTASTATPTTAEATSTVSVPTEVMSLTTLMSQPNL